MTITITNIDKRTVRVYGMTKEQVAKITTYSATEKEGGGLEFRTNRNERAQLATLARESAKPARGGWNSRHVQLAHVAERDGLNHGQVWICRENDIQTKGAHPSWEGDFICYVYE